MTRITTRRSFLQLIGLAPVGYHFLQARGPAEMLTLYVGTYTDGDSEGIYRCHMDADTGDLEIIEATGGIANPSFLAFHPDRTHLYAVSETTSFEDGPGGGVFAYAVDAAGGGLRSLNAKPSRGGAPCYVSVTPDGRFVLVANYVGGNVAILPVQPDGSLGEATDVEQHEGSGPNEERQEAPHAHCILPDPSGRFACAVDLGIDRVIVYRSDDGNLMRASEMALQPGAGPRHLAFHPNGRRAYVINELDSTLTACTYDDGVLEPTHTISTLPPGIDAENYCADIHVAANGRFVYGSNRGHDSIVVFAVDDASGHLSAIQHVPTGGSWPRNFALDPSGRFLLVANQHTDDVVVFSVDGATGRLAPTGHTLAIPSPVCLRFAA